MCENMWAQSNAPREHLATVGYTFKGTIVIVSLSLESGSSALYADQAPAWFPLWFSQPLSSPWASLCSHPQAKGRSSNSPVPAELVWWRRLPGACWSPSRPHCPQLERAHVIPVNVEKGEMGMLIPTCGQRPCSALCPSSCPFVIRNVPPRARLPRLLRPPPGTSGRTLPKMKTREPPLRPKPAGFQSQGPSNCCFPTSWRPLSPWPVCSTKTDSS